MTIFADGGRYPSIIRGSVGTADHKILYGKYYTGYPKPADTTELQTMFKITSSFTSWFQLHFFKSNVNENIFSIYSTSTSTNLGDFGFYYNSDKTALVFYANGEATEWSQPLSYFENKDIYVKIYPNYSSGQIVISLTTDSDLDTATFTDVYTITQAMSSYSDVYYYVPYLYPTSENVAVNILHVYSRLMRTSAMRYVMCDSSVCLEDIRNIFVGSKKVTKIVNSSGTLYDSTKYLTSTLIAKYPTSNAPNVFASCSNTSSGIYPFNACDFGTDTYKAKFSYGAHVFFAQSATDTLTPTLNTTEGGMDRFCTNNYSYGVQNLVMSESTYGNFLYGSTDKSTATTNSPSLSKYGEMVAPSQGVTGNGIEYTRYGTDRMLIFKMGTYTSSGYERDFVINSGYEKGAYSKHNSLIYTADDAIGLLANPLCVHHSSPFGFNTITNYAFIMGVRTHSTTDYGNYYTEIYKINEATINTTPIYTEDTGTMYLTTNNWYHSITYAQNASNYIIATYANTSSNVIHVYYIDSELNVTKVYTGVLPNTSSNKVCGVVFDKYIIYASQSDCYRTYIMDLSTQKYKEIPQKEYDWDYPCTPRGANSTDIFYTRGDGNLYSWSQSDIIAKYAP